MKKIQLSETQIFHGSGAVCDFVSGGLSGWGLAGVFVGGAAAATGVGFVLAGMAVGLYCSSRNAI